MVPLSTFVQSVGAGKWGWYEILPARDARLRRPADLEAMMGDHFR